METDNSLFLVFVTVPDLDIARKLSAAALEARLAACANIVPGVESHYWWRGKLEQSAELLVLFKSTSAALEKLEQLILSSHPYDTPEIIAVPVSAGTPRYLKWWRDETAK